MGDDNLSAKVPRIQNFHRKLNSLTNQGLAYLKAPQYAIATGKVNVHHVALHQLQISTNPNMMEASPKFREARALHTLHWWNRPNDGDGIQPVAFWKHKPTMLQ